MIDRIFVVDLARCTGCRTCVIACRDRADAPDGVSLLRVETTEAGIYPRPELTHRVIHCFHCGRPSCVDACPSGAISRQSNGLMVLEASRCTGCGTCLNSCPFDAITLLPSGVAAMCDGCPDDIAAGWVPTCVRACPLRALDYVPSVEMQIGAYVPDPTFGDYGMAPRVLYLRRPKRHSSPRAQST